MRFVYAKKGDYEEVPVVAREKGLKRMYRFVCTKPYTVCVEMNGIRRRITVPAFFLSDGASSCCASNAGYAWLVHDWCYAMHEWDDGTHITRSEADALMYILLKAETRNVDAPTWWLAMRLNLCGVPRKSWKKSGKRGPVYGEFQDYEFTIWF